MGPGVSCGTAVLVGEGVDVPMVPPGVGVPVGVIVGVLVGVVEGV